MHIQRLIMLVHQKEEMENLHFVHICLGSKETEHQNIILQQTVDETLEPKEKFGDTMLMR